METWKKIKLGSACRTNTDSYSPKEKWDFVNYLDTGNITNNTIDSIQFIDLAKQKLPSRAKRKVRTDSIVYSTVRPNQHHFGIIKSQPDNFLVSTGFAVLDVDADVLNADFLYYLLTQNTLVEALHSIAEQSTSAYPAIKPSDIENLVIEIPDLAVQKKIAGILNSLDRKIEKNVEINKNLEQQAKAVFKSWFEDFDPFDEPLIETPAGIYAPASLQMVQIANIPHVLETGKRPKGGAVASGVPSIGAENVKQLGVVNFSSAKFIPEEFAEKMKTGAINGYELLLYKDGGKPGTFIPHFSMFGEGFPYQKFFINEHVFKLDFGDKGFNEFAYFFMQTDYAYHWLASNGGKAAVPGINQQNVKDIWIFSPENSKVKEFGEWVQPLFTTILKNCAQNVKLAELRDTLLPKLMSGELDVSDIEL